MCAFWPMSRKTTEWYEINVVYRAEQTKVGPNDEKKSGIRRPGSDLRAVGTAYDKILAKVHFTNAQQNLMYRQLSSVKATKPTQHGASCLQRNQVRWMVADPDSPDEKR
jgi:hypothetical protein